MIEAVLLDMGGVLLEAGPAAGLPFGRLDWRGRRALLELLRRDRRRLELADLERLLFDPWEKEHRERYRRMREADWAPHLAALRRHAGSERDDLELLEAWFRPYGEWLQPLPGAASVLTRLRAGGFRLALISNVPLPGALFRPALERHGLAAAFEDLRFSYDESSRKPSPRMLLAALAALGVPPGSAVMVGDRKSADVAAGRAAGTRTVWLRSPHAQGGPSADAEIGSLAELAPLVESW